MEIVLLNFLILWCQRSLKIKNFSVELIYNLIYFSAEIRNFISGWCVVEKWTKIQRLPFPLSFELKRRVLLFFSQCFKNMVLCSLWGLFAYPKEMHLESHNVHRKNNTAEGNQRMPKGERPREKPSSYKSTKIGTEMQTLIELKSPQNSLL